MADEVVETGATQVEAPATATPDATPEAVGGTPAVETPPPYAELTVRGETYAVPDADRGKALMQLGRLRELEGDWFNDRIRQMDDEIERRAQELVRQGYGRQEATAQAKHEADADGDFYSEIRNDPYGRAIERLDKKLDQMGQSWSRAEQERQAAAERQSEAEWTKQQNTRYETELAKYPLFESKFCKNSAISRLAELVRAGMGMSGRVGDRPEDLVRMVADEIGRDVDTLRSTAINTYSRGKADLATKIPATSGGGGVPGGTKPDPTKMTEEQLEAEFLSRLRGSE